MKKNLLALTIILFVNIAVAVTPNNENENYSTNGITAKSLIEATTFGPLDTVYFAVSQSIVVGGYVEFPVYFKLNTPTDTVNALDFSLQFDTSKYAYDTVITIPNYLGGTPNYDTIGLTLYYTANTGRPQGITNDTTIAKVRLWILSTGPLCLNSPLAYLNGDECSTKVSNSNCISLGISEIENENLLLSLYPNPTDGLATFNFYSSIRENGALSLEDLTGRIIQKADISMIEGYNNNPIDLRNLSSGVYTLSLQTSHDRKAIRIIKY